MKKVSQRKISQCGFSLVEIMVVLIIMGLIVGVVATNVMERLEKAKVETAKIQLRSIEQALDAYRLDNGRYPTTEQGLEALVTKPTTPPIPNNYPSEGYFKGKGEEGAGSQVPLDPWSNPYQYTSEAPNKYRISSLGADGVEGGEDSNKDIVVSR